MPVFTSKRRQDQQWQHEQVDQFESHARQFIVAGLPQSRLLLRTSEAGIT